MRILHAYCMNYNVGDYFLARGVRNILRKYLEVDYIADTNIQGQYFNEYYINEVVNKRFDLLVIGGGGLIDGAHWPNGWFWLCDKDLIKSIKIPFVVYGVGVNYFSAESIPQKAVAHLTETQRCAAAFSVRNDGSKPRYDAALGTDVAEVPDPGFFVWENYGKPHGLQRHVVFQPAFDKIEKRLGECTDAFLHALTQYLNELSRQHHVILLPHTYADVEVLRRLPLDGNDVEMFDFGAHAFDDIEKFLDVYNEAEFVVSMRGHSQIVPIARNIPVLCLSNHPKHASLMNKLGLGAYVVDAWSDHLLSDLQQTTFKLETDRKAIVEKESLLNSTFRVMNDKYWHKIVTDSI